MLLEAVSKTLRPIGTNETHDTLLENICTGTTARVYIDVQVSEETPVLRVVRQGDPVSPKLFRARRERNKYKWRKLSGLRFADDVALTPEGVKRRV